MSTGEGKRKNEGWVEGLKTTSKLVMPVLFVSGLRTAQSH